MKINNGKDVGLLPVGSVAKVVGWSMDEGTYATSFYIRLGLGNESTGAFPVPDRKTAEEYLNRLQDKYVVVTFNPASGVLSLNPVRIATI